MRRLSSEYITPENFGDSFLHGESEYIYKQCSLEFQKIITLEQFKELLQTFNHNVDHYQLIQTTSLGSHKQYLWLDNRNEKAISVIFDESNEIQRLLVKPFVTFPNSDRRYTKNSYTMPIKDEWIVFWGGKNEFLNYHYVYESQRYAYDLVIMKNEQTYKDNQMSNVNYHAFNKEIVAPADGKVVKMVNHVFDNTPGEMNESELAGNFVVLEHANNEYSLIAHFKQNSIVVKKGDIVKQGQFLGLCGNSGNSSEPHIHFQVMDKPELERCKSLCIQFTNGQDPIQGDRVSQGPKTHSNDNKLDTVDKAEIGFTFIDVLLFIPRLIGSYFK